jgi:hypothetical protein
VSERRLDDMLSDAALDGEIARALAIDPSPEFLAKVRARVSRAPEPQGWRAAWMPAAAAAAAAVLIAAFSLRRPAVEPETGANVPAIAATALALPLAQVMPARPLSLRAPERQVAAAIAREVPAESSLALQVLVPRGERIALRRLIGGIRQGVVDPRRIVETPFDFAAIETGAVVIAPLAPISSITIESLGSPVREEGVVRQ